MVLKTILKLANLQSILLNFLDHLFTNNAVKMKLINYYALNMVYKKHLD